MIRFRNQDLFANGIGTVQYLTKVDLEFNIWKITSRMIKVIFPSDIQNFGDF